MKTLLVDDDPEFRRFMRDGLEESGITCVASGDGETARDAVRDHAPFDLILLDVMMPGESGWEFLEALRAQGDETPVIFLTARHEVRERVRGLRLGADDYIVKPFDFSELLARIDAVYRRHRQGAKLRVRDLVIDCERRSVLRDDERVELTPREFDLLLTLARARGRVLSREELLKEVWGIEFDPETNVVNVLVARLRSKLDRGAPSLIRTIVGEGYTLAEDDE